MEERDRKAKNREAEVSVDRDFRDPEEGERVGGSGRWEKERGNEAQTRGREVGSTGIPHVRCQPAAQLGIG
jgi:hypothetical protein